MSLQIYPCVEGYIGEDTKNLYVARASVPIGNLTADMIKDSGLLVGDTVYITDSSGNYALYKVLPSFALDTYVVGSNAAANMTASGSFAVGDIFKSTNLTGTQVISAGPLPVVDPNTVTSPAVGVTSNIVEYNSNDRTVKDSGIPKANIVTASSNGVVDQLPKYAGANKVIVTSGIDSGDVVTSSAVGVLDEIALYDGANKTLKTSGKKTTDFATIASPTFTGGIKLNSATVALPTAGQATITGNTLSGATILGSGTSSDITIGNKTGGSVLAVPTGTTDANFSGKVKSGNIQIDGNTIKSTDTNGNIILAPDGTGVVTGITKAMVGLGNVDNTTDLLKPLSTATINALALKALNAYPDSSNYFPAIATTVPTTLDNVGKALGTVGQVKINDRGGAKPNYALVANAAEVSLNYASQTGAFTVSSSTKAPIVPNATFTDALFYDFTNNTFLENDVSLQGCRWRFIFGYTKTNNDKPTFIFRLANDFNVSSSFTQSVQQTIGKGTSGFLVVDMTTISNSLSLPSGTGAGYNLYLSTIDKNITVTLESVTRFSDSVQPF